MSDINTKKNEKINVELSTSDLKLITQVLNFATKEIELAGEEIEQMKEMAKEKDNELLLLDNERWRQLNSKYGKQLQQLESIETLHHYLTYTLKLHDIDSNSSQDTDQTSPPL